MSAVSDKARFYLEQSVPQLREFEEKNIFSKEEIRTLVTKRTDFEHKILARGTQPVDFARYAAWEISLEKLRSKRCRRLKVSGSSSQTGQARVFAIFERGTKKHPGDVDLWMTYMQYVRDVRAVQRFKKVLTAALRLHCTKAEFWLYGAKFSLEYESDMSSARSYMQRGIRFCNTDKYLWLEYAKLEMIYLAKIYLRRQILGLDRSTTNDDTTEEAGSDGLQEDLLPSFGPASLQPDIYDRLKVDSDANHDPATTPALQGAIPLAIFDSARKQSFFNASVAEDFFSMFALFHQVPCLRQISQHVVDVMAEAYPTDPLYWSCFVRQPVAGVLPSSAEFPDALADVLCRLQPAVAKSADKEVLATRTQAWIEPLLTRGGLDPGVETVLKHILKRVQL